MDKLFWIGFVGAVVAGLFAVLQAKKVMGYSEGTERMQKLASSIREGANAYLKRQYTTVLKVFAIVFVVLLVIAFASGGKMLSKFTPFAFVTGGIWSMRETSRSPYSTSASDRGIGVALMHSRCAWRFLSDSAAR